MKERRIELVKAPTAKDQAAFIRAADLVIWAAGYETNGIPFYDHEDKEIPL